MDGEMKDTLPPVISRKGSTTAAPSTDDDADTPARSRRAIYSDTVNKDNTFFAIDHDVDIFNPCEEHQCPVEHRCVPGMHNNKPTNKPTCVKGCECGIAINYAYGKRGYCQVSTIWFAGEITHADATQLVAANDWY